MTGAQLAREAGITQQALNYWKEQLISEGYAEPGIIRIDYHESAIEWLKSRIKNKQGTQGGGKKRHDELFAALKKEGLQPKKVFYSYNRIKGFKGWFYNKKGVEYPIFLGKNFKTALNNIYSCRIN